MSLKKFREEDKKKNQIIVFTIVCILLIAGVFLYQSYALFETKDNFNVVSGSIEKPGDLSFAFYVNDEIVLEAPSKESNLALSEKSNCNNGVTVSWNVESWNASVDYSNYKQEKTSKTKCNLFFREAMYSDYVTSCGENGNTAVDCMKKYSDKDTINLVYDETVDNNLRYIGSNPDNYVDIGDRNLDGNTILWRIIGVMENIKKSENSESETRLKIIRDNSIGLYSWDSSPSNINSGYGVSEWSQADVMKLLNPGFESISGGSLYWNSSSGSCYSNQANTMVACDFKSSGLSPESYVYFDEALWHLGTYQGGDSITNTYLLASQHYSYERSNNHSKICGAICCDDTVTRTTRWTGNVGLMYASDYSYATSGGFATNRETCLKTHLYDWRNSNVSDCKNNNWLFSSLYGFALMTPSPFSNWLSSAPVGAGIRDLGSDGSVSNMRASQASHIRPVLYLKSKVQITKGEGTSTNPYKIELSV